MRARETNNIIERAHSTLKTRSRVFRGLKNDKSSRELLDGYITNYNFCRKHSSIKTTPAQSAGLTLERWNELIRQSQTYKTNQELKVIQK
ncbi:MAG: DDE-type integrase/transposase/recombinase [Thaumarchaeota archaeon]|nr:MAG: DDE-type integrase/transposase/recombinase [Nitrososphaerota archaeon]